MTSSRTLTHYLLFSQALVSFLINIVIALGTSIPGLIRNSDGQQTFATQTVSCGELHAEIAGTSFFLPFFTCMICTPLVWNDVRQGRITGRAGTSSQKAFRNPWDTTRRSRVFRVLRRSVVYGIGSFLAVGWPLTLIIDVYAPDPAMSRFSFIVSRTLIIATAGAIVTPLIALRALSDCRSDSPALTALP
jgi:hypothetical protein